MVEARFYGGNRVVDNFFIVIGHSILLVVCCAETICYLFPESAAEMMSVTLREAHSPSGSHFHRSILKMGCPLTAES